MESEPPRIVGDFKLKRELGRGGMGVVYLARQISLGRDVALKLLPLDGGFDESRVLRFQREAAMLGRLSDPCIVKVFTVGEHGPYHFLAMEYVEGTDLERVLESHQQRREEDLPEAFRRDFRTACVETMRDVAQALRVAHAAGIVHRDVKPSNILLEKTGRSVLADFGLARDVGVAALTRSNVAVGTPYYMSPERFTAVEPTAQSDVYATGAVLYQCITGVRPFDAETPEALMQKILHEEAVPPRRIDSSIPRDLQTIVLTCLERNPAARYRDGGALSDDLDRYLRGEPIAANPTSAITQAFRKIQRRRTSLLSLIGMLVLAVAFLAFWVSEHRAKKINDARNEIAKALNRDDPKQAEEALDRLLSEYPDLEDARFDRADLHLRLKRWQDAAADYEMLAHQGSTYANAAELARRFASALATKTGLDQIEITGEPKDGREAFYRGIVLQARRDLVGAEREHDKATKLPPMPIEAYFSLGAIRFRRGDFLGAESAFLRYKAERTRAEVDNFLGQIEFAKENYDAARSLFDHFIARQPQSVVGWNNLAATYLALAVKYDDNNWHDQAEQSRQSAEDAIEKAKTLDPKYFLLAFNEASALVQRGDIGEAKKLFERALEGCNNDPYWYISMHWQFARQLLWVKDSKHAIELLENGAKANPSFLNDFSFVYAYADTLASGGRRDDALAIIDQALAGALAGNEKLAKKRADIAAM